MQNDDAVNASGAERKERKLVDLDDGSLLAMARSGSSEAYATLFSRYSYAARRLARHLGQREDSDDVVSEAFAQVLDLLSRGKGPQTAFRAYLFTTVRHECARRARACKRTTPTDDLQQIDSAVAFGGGELDAFEREAIRAAYTSLPPRWRSVLWHLDVEGRTPQELGPLLNLSANSVSALVYRARAGLRQAYLQQHVKQEKSNGGRACDEYRTKLSALVRRTATDRDQQRIHAHLEACKECVAIYLDLQEVNRDVGRVAESTVTLGAVGLALASVGAHASVLLKSIAAVLVPSAAAVAMANAMMASTPRLAAPEPMRRSATDVVRGVSGHHRAEPVRSDPAMQADASATTAVAPDDDTAVPRAAVAPAADSAFVAASVTPAPIKSGDRSPAAAPPTATAPPVPAGPPVVVRIELPVATNDETLARATASVGSVEVTVGGPGGLLLLRSRQ